MIDRIQKLKNKKGFTLVELIVVIAIIAILTAVIVPLVGRYAAQATYTTLQDGAQTVENTCNNVLSEVTRMGTVYKDKVVTGDKTGGTLTVTAGSKSATATDADSITSTTDDDTKVAAKLALALQDAIPDGASFYIKVNTSTVGGVVYSNSAGNKVNGAAPSGLKIADSSFDEAYENGTGAIGVSGEYLTEAKKSAGSSST